MRILSLSVLLSFILNAAFLCGAENYHLAPAPYTSDQDTVVLLHWDGTHADASVSALAFETQGGGFDSGVIGKAWRTDGKAPLTCALAKEIDLSKGFTLEAWIWLDYGASGDERTVFECPGVVSCFVLGSARTAARIGFQISTDKGTFEAKTDDVIPYERWAHVAWTYDPHAPAEQALSVHVHGMAVESEWGFDKRSAVQGTLKPCVKSLKIGGGFSGALDELRLSAKPQALKDCHNGWLSGRWGDFQPFVPDAIAQADAAAVPPNEARLTAAEAVPTFQALGLYVRYSGDENGDAACKVAYRRKGDAEWRPGLDLIPDRKDHEFRGSLFYLEPGTAYELQLALADPDIKRPVPALTLEKSTWTDAIPVGEVKELPAGERKAGTLVIEAHGKPDAWVVYRPAAGQSVTIDGGAEAADAVLIRDSSYVVLEGVNVIGGAENAVRVLRSRHVCIRHCEMSGWGSLGTPGPGTDKRAVDAKSRHINYHAGIRIDLGSEAVVAEHNFIHSPRGHANNWSLGHPMGPQAFVIANTAGHHVIRYNDCIGCEGHRFNDVIESIENGSAFGGPYRDTDIHDNFLAYSNDDGVELDGGQINVRFWNNRQAYSLCGISCAPCRKGPAYIVRNVFGPLGDDRGSCGSTYKMGGGIRWSLGRDVILHNTIYGPGRGLSSVGYGSGEERGRYRAYARNNLFAGGGGLDVFDKLKDAENDFDFDLLGRGGVEAVEGAEAHAVKAKPTFADEPAGNWQLAEGSPGIDAGQPLPNINDGFFGKAPDMGAFETGGAQRAIPSRPFGLAASPQWVRIDSREAGGAKLKLTVPAPVGKRWSVRPSEDWLKAEPKEGDCGPDSQTLSLTAATKELGDRHGALTLRTDAGYQVSVLVSARTYPQKPWEHDVEAEAGELSGGMQKAESKDASGGFYVYTPIPANGADGKPGPVVKGEAVYKFEVPEDGTYYLRARCLCPEPSGSHDSFTFSMDGESRKTWDVKAGATRWSWCFLIDPEDKSEGMCLLKLKKGSHTLKLITREAGTSIDRLVFANHPFPTQAEAP
ncbi:MAG: hypothetical protein HY291_11525 [Planctomycetes bacterium]|nr:hypothetical protein [Planctomycetota bacterium]